MSIMIKACAAVSVVGLVSMSYRAHQVRTEITDLKGNVDRLSKEVFQKTKDLVQINEKLTKVSKEAYCWRASYSLRGLEATADKESKESNGYRYIRFELANDLEHARGVYAECIEGVHRKMSI